VEYRSATYRFARLGVRAAPIDVAAADTLDAQPLAAAMAEAGYAGQPTMLAIPSEWCLSASTVLASRRLTRNRQAVTYATEEHLPLSAEDMVCDYVAHETHILSVVANCSTLLPVVSSLEDAGIAVTTITPTAMLFLQYLSQLRWWPTDGLVLLSNGDQIELFAMAAARPRQWISLPRAPDAVRREVSAFLLNRSDDYEPLRICAVESVHEIESAIKELGPEVQVETRKLDGDEILLGEANKVLAKGKRPWIELRRDQLGQYDPYRLVRGSIGALLVSVLIALASLTTAAWTQGNKYDRLVQSTENEKRELFRELFPDARVPAGIRSRLESEQRKMVGLSVDETQVPELQSVTAMLVKTLAALPTDLRFRLLDIGLEEKRGSLEGEVRRHGDADIVASSLRASGLAVEPPGTEQLAEEGVGFRLDIATTVPDAD
jgi:type II secretory pathway component PulL